MVWMPGEIKGKSWKFACPYYGPFRVVSPTNAEVVLVVKPDEETIFVSLMQASYTMLRGVTGCFLDRSFSVYTTTANLSEKQDKKA